MNEMTEERVACSTCNGQGYYYRRPDDHKKSWDLQKCDHETNLLRVENERLRGALTELTDWDYCRNSSDWGPCSGPAQEHESNCPNRIAYAALNPEPPSD